MIAPLTPQKRKPKVISRGLILLRNVVSHLYKLLKMRCVVVQHYQTMIPILVSIGHLIQR